MKNNYKFNWDDILLEQSPIGLNKRNSDIYIDGMLPLITAPMDTVVSAENAHHFINNKINVCLPRNCSIPNLPLNSYWVSYGLEEAKYLLEKDEPLIHKNICIDVANGNMPALHDTIYKLKEKYSDVVIMSGNVASPAAFTRLAYTGVDYIRCGVGFGGSCLTSYHTSVGYPMASLIHECAEAKRKLKLHSSFNAKIVADGGFKKYSDVIKALALGADYVMLGGIFNKTFESSGGFYSRDLPWDKKEWEYKEIDKELAVKLLKHDKEVFKSYRGMSTKAVQREWGKENIRSSEGITTYQQIEYTLNDWISNFEDYLRSAMSYTGADNLGQFKHSKFNLITNEAYKGYNK